MTRFCAGCYAATLFKSFSARFFVKINLFLRFIFRKNVDADFYGLSDIDSVVTDFHPNKREDLELLCFISFVAYSIYSFLLSIIQTIITMCSMNMSE